MYSYANEYMSLAIPSPLASVKNVATKILGLPVHNLPLNLLSNSKTLLLLNVIMTYKSNARSTSNALNMFFLG